MTAEEPKYRYSNFSKKTDSFQTMSRFTDRKLGSKKKTISSDTRLKELTGLALKLLMKHL